jgi:uncharacterized membrane protein
MSDHALDPRPSRTGRWLAQRRLMIALWIAVVEGVFVAIERDVTKWTVIAIAIPIVLLYLFVGRTAQSDTLRQVSWIAGASQVFAALLAILFILIELFTIILIVVLAVIAAIFLYADRPGGPRSNRAA